MKRPGEYTKTITYPAGTMSFTGLLLGSDCGDLHNSQKNSIPANIHSTVVIPSLTKQPDEQMQEKPLRGTGVTVDVQNNEDVTHEFFDTGSVIGKAEQAVAQVGVN